VSGLAFAPRQERFPDDKGSFVALLNEIVGEMHADGQRSPGSPPKWLEERDVTVKPS